MPPDTQTTPLLTMRGITKRFGGVAALTDVSLNVGRAEILALIGENGAGKSTLMKVLGGVHRPDAGEILWEGQPVRITSVTDASRLGIAFIHQELTVLDNLDVAGNVFLGREPLKNGWLLDRARMEAETTKLLARLGLNVPPDTPVSTLSLAQRQMVEIARALSQAARLIIMDEPTASLTPAETDRLLAVATDLRESQGVSIIYISHRLGEINRIADRVTGLRDGKNAGDLARDEITQERMVRLMVGRDILREEAHGTEGRDLPVRLEVKGLRTHRYPAKNVSFALRAGEILGFAGLVGAGRTEVAEAVFGIMPPLAGEILLNGKAITVRKPNDAITAGIALVPEDRRRHGLILSLPIRENISLPSLERFASPHNVIGLINRSQERAVAEEASKRADVRSAAATVELPAGNLSGGNQQKVVLAKWLARDPQVVILDEPTRGVDVGAKAQIYERIRSLARDENVAVWVISSDMEEVLTLCDRIAVMHEGTITGIVPHREATEETIMRLAVGHEGK